MTDDERQAASSMYNLHRFTEGEALCTSALSRNANDVDALYLLGQMYLAQYRAELALKYNDRASAMSDDIRITLQRAEALFSLKRIDDAAESYKLALTKEANNAQAIYGLGKVEGYIRANTGTRSITKAPTDETSGASKELSVYSARGEQEIIEHILNALDPEEKFVVDIGAADGITWSNSYALIMAGWRGLCIEPNHSALASLGAIYQGLPQRVNIVSAFASPHTICQCLTAMGVPPTPGFLSIDIDSFEYDLLDRILRSFRPELVCVEINERCPPPVKYALRYTEHSKLDDMAIYGGCSISLMTELLNSWGYAVVKLEYNNLFAVRKSLITKLPPEFPELTAEDAYASGYLNKPDRLSWMPWNQPFEALRRLSTDAFIEQYRQLIAHLGFEFTLKI